MSGAEFPGRQPPGREPRARATLTESMSDSGPGSERPPDPVDTTKPRPSKHSRVTSLRIRALDEQGTRVGISFRYKLMLAFGLSTLVVGALTFLGVRMRFRDASVADAATELTATRRVFENLVDSQYAHLESAGRLIADAPKLRAAIETQDPGTVADESAWFRLTGQADLLAVISASGTALAFNCMDRGCLPDTAGLPEVKGALKGVVTRGLLDYGGRLYMTVGVPVGLEREVTGAVLIGQALADAAARRIHGITGVQVAFLSNGQPRATSLDSKSLEQILTQTPPTSGPPQVTPANLGGVSQLTLRGQFAPDASSRAMDYLLVLSLAGREAAQARVEGIMLIGGAACLLVMVVISGVISRRFSRGITQLVDAANAMARGNFDLPITVPPGDEIGYLAHALGELRGSVAEQVRKLARMNDNLRGKIEEILFNETLGTQYDEVSILGRGGMGIVYRAHNTERGCRVAIKVLSPMLAEVPSVVTRFMREGQILQRLDHPALIRTFLVDQSKLPYCEMEYFEGKSLAHVVREEGSIPWPRARALMDQVLSALSYCHGAGVIHRDVKPSNILLGAGDTLRLIDFGLARDESLTALTHSREAFGTPDYTAPEQERGQDVDERADVYSAGQTLYFLLAGQVVKFRAAGYVPLSERLAHREDRPPSSLDAIVQRALAFDPADRWESCEAFRLALHRV